MWKNSTIRFFMGFTALLLLQGALLLSFFAHSTWKDSENAIYETLLRKSQLTAALTAQDLLLGETPDVSANKRKVFLFSPAKGALGVNHMSIDPGTAQEIFEGSAQESLVTKCLATDGRELYCGFAPIEKSRFYAVEALPRSSRINILVAQMKKLIPSFLGLLLLAGLAAWAVTYYLLAPLRSITLATKAFMKGQADLRALPYGRSDEIGQLAQSFREMVTELQAREKNLTKAGLKLAHQARLASIGQMGASIAHEVKNPLTSMMGYAKYLLNKTSDPELKEAAAVIQRESERCGQILTQMLRFSRNDANEFKLFSVKEVVESSKLLTAAELKNYRMSLSIDYIHEPIVLGNPLQIQQVILNLIVNAIQACSPLLAKKPEASQLKMTISEDEGRARIKLEDSGPGMNNEVQMRLFEPFFTTKERGSGTGLGLSVALEILHSHGGDLQFESKEGRGSVFWIDLPTISDASRATTGRKQS
jgi:signal transduction histidine kinase